MRSTCTSANTTMQGEVDMLPSTALDDLENKANKNFIKFSVYKQEQSLAIQGSGYFPLLKAC